MKQSIILLVIFLDLQGITKIEKKVNSVGRFELAPYGDDLKDISPASKFNVLDCYLIINNKTNNVLRITLFQRKDYTNKAAEIIALQDGRESYYKLPRNKITGFALPRLKWCEKIVLSEADSRSPQILESLKTAPIIGFSVSKPKEEIPIIPEFLLPKERQLCISYIYDIIPADNRHGFEIQQVLSQTRE